MTISEVSRLTDRFFINDFNEYVLLFKKRSIEKHIRESESRIRVSLDYVIRIFVTSIVEYDAIILE